MARIIVAVLLIVLTVGQSAAFEYDAKRTVTAAQEALVRLGYDPGLVDGQWGGKTREAMNALRSANGLPPAQDFVGSSLALVHRLSPGETTFPKPGFFIADPVARAKVLQSDDQLRKRQCPSHVGQGLLPEQMEPVAKISPFPTPDGYIDKDADWFSRIMEGLVAAQDNCLAGVENACRAVVDMAQRWAEADAIRPGTRPGTGVFENMAWVANALMRNVILAYGLARQFEPVDPVKEAAVLDWLKRRIDDYQVDGFRRLSNNHAMAHGLALLSFGVLVGDRTMAEPALEVWRNALDSMRKDGSLPDETERGARWAHYTSIQIGQLLTTAELAEGQDIDLYATAPQGRSIQQAVAFWLAALQDFDLASPYAKANVGPGPSRDYRIPEFKEFSSGWLPAYQAEFGDDDNIVAMRSAVLDSRFCSDRAMDEGKLQPNFMCHGPDTVLPMSVTLVMMRPQPISHMGYPAGCLQGTRPWVLDE